MFKLKWNGVQIGVNCDQIVKINYVLILFTI